MSDLDGLDFTILISTLLTFLAGSLPNFIDVKKNGKFTKFTPYLIGIIFVGLATAIGSTLQKSKEDKAEYKALTDSLNVAVKKITATLALSNKTLTNSAAAISTLDSLSNSTENLNDSLSRELNIQRETNAHTSQLVASLSRENSIRLKNYRKSLKTSFQLVQKNYYYVFSWNANANYTIDDSIRISLKLDRFLNDNLNWLVREINNPILLEDKEIFSIWDKYIRDSYYLHAKVNGYDAGSITSMLKLAEKSARAFEHDLSGVFQKRHSGIFQLY